MALTVATTTVATAVPAYAAFDADYYAKQNPDVVAVVGTTPKALENHYNLFGKNEGRAASAEEANGSELRQIFDAKLYAQLYPDVVAVYGTDADKLFQHFLTFGINEGRKVNNYFDVKAYKDAYPDLQKAFGDNIAAYYKHFATFGIKEHRTAGGFPAENILPGGAKKTTVVASSGGGGGSSDGGASGGSAGGGGNTVNPANGLPTNVAKNEKSVTSANDTLTTELEKYGTRDVDGNLTITGTVSKKDKDALVASATSTLVAAKAVNETAQKNLATATAEKDAADTALENAEKAIKESENPKVAKYDKDNSLVKDVAAKQAAYYDEVDDLEAAKEAQAEAAAELVKAQAAVKTAQANYDTALKNAKDTYVACGGEAAYVAHSSDVDIISKLDDMAGKETASKNKNDVNGMSALDDKDKPLAIIGEDGKIDDANYKAAVKKAEDKAKADTLAEYQLAYINAIKGSADSYIISEDEDNGKIKPEIKAELAKYGVTADAWTSAGKGDKITILPDSEDLSKLNATVLKDTKIDGKNVTEAQTAAASGAKEAIDTAINEYKAASSKEAFTSAIEDKEAKEDAVIDANAALNGGKDSKGDDIEGAVNKTKKEEKDVSNAAAAIKTAEEARDKAYAEDGVAGNAALVARDKAQATASKEADEFEKANDAAETAAANVGTAQTNYEDATNIPIKAEP